MHHGDVHSVVRGAFRALPGQGCMVGLGDFSVWFVRRFLGYRLDCTEFNDSQTPAACGFSRLLLRHIFQPSGTPHSFRCLNNEGEQRILAVDRPGTALLRARRGFLRGLRALPRGDTWPHVVEMPICFWRNGTKPCTGGYMVAT